MPSPAKPVPLSHLKPGPPADCFALLAEKSRGTTRDGKPYFTCRFKDRLRTADAKVWADSPTFAACETDWLPGRCYKLRATYGEHERYGPQIDVHQLRPITDADKDDGFRLADFFDCSRFDPEAMWIELRGLAESEIADIPLRTLVLTLLDAHAEAIKQLPAHPRAFFPFPGGWLEHTLSVTRSAVWLADKYRAHYPELASPLNRDLVVAGAILHDLGRAVELVPGVAGLPAVPTVLGGLFGHLALGRDLVRDAARAIPDLNPELVLLLEHIVYAHLTKPEWGSPRQPAIPEVLIIHHADDLDAKLEMFARCLRLDATDGPFTSKDTVVGRPLLKGRTV